MCRALHDDKFYCAPVPNLQRLINSRPLGRQLSHAICIGTGSNGASFREVVEPTNGRMHDNGSEIQFQELSQHFYAESFAG